MLGLLLLHFTDERIVAELAQFIQSWGQWSRDSNISPIVGQCLSSQPLHHFFFFENYKHYVKYYCDSALRNVSLFYHYLIWSSQQPCRGGIINCIQQTRKLRVIGLNISIYITDVWFPIERYQAMKVCLFQTNFHVFSLVEKKYTYHTQNFIFDTFL